MGIAKIRANTVKWTNIMKAAELLGKRYNLFSDKMKVDVAMPVVISGGEDLED